jgi:hypothetical protein
VALFTFPELVTKTTPEAVKAQIYAYLESIGITTTAWQALSPTRTLIDVFSRILAVTLNLVVQVCQGGFRALAKGTWLTTWSSEMRGVDRNLATFATTDLVLNNSGGGVYDFDTHLFVVKNAVTGKTYFNTDPLHIGALATNVTCHIQADEIGSASNATPGQITVLVTSANGVTCTNPASAAGEDEETDDELAARDDDALGALSPNGAAGAYAYVAKTPSLNGGVTINRVRILPPPGDGTLTVVVASPAGSVSPGDIALVQDAIDRLATPPTATTTVVSASPLIPSYTPTIFVSSASGYSGAQAITIANAALSKYLNSVPIGGFDLGSGGVVPWRAVIAEIKKADPFFLQASLSVESDIAVGASSVVVPGISGFVINFV